VLQAQGRGMGEYMVKISISGLQNWSKGDRQKLGTVVMKRVRVVHS